MVKLASLKGGSLRNAIPRESSAIVVCEESNVKKFFSVSESAFNAIREEFKTIEPNLRFVIDPVDTPLHTMQKDDQSSLLNALDAALNGVFKMSDEIEDLVEASNNIASVTVENGFIAVACLTRSSIEESKALVANSLKEVFEKEGFEVEFSGSYPGWSPNRNSPILKVLESIYFDLYKSKPAVVACHAGLECGILGTHYPDMDMISFGPTIKGAHSPDERASISSAARFWLFLQEILKNIPT
jgi:dipeptidase D